MRHVRIIRTGGRKRAAATLSVADSNGEDSVSEARPNCRQFQGMVIAQGEELDIAIRILALSMRIGRMLSGRRAL